jgi:hypothetical protein
MAIDGRIRELGSRHQTLERAIEEELRHPSADSLRVRELKLQKLRVKEQIEVLRGARAH